MKTCRRRAAAASSKTAGRRKAHRRRAKTVKRRRKTSWRRRVQTMKGGMQPFNGQVQKTNPHQTLGVGYKKDILIDQSLQSLSTADLSALVKTYFENFGLPLPLSQKNVNAYLVFVDKAKTTEKFLQVTIYPYLAQIEQEKMEKYKEKLNKMTSDLLIKTHELYGEEGKVTFKMYFSLENLRILQGNIYYIQSYIIQNINKINTIIYKFDEKDFLFTVKLTNTPTAFVVTVESPNFEFSDEFKSDVVNFLNDLYVELSLGGVEEFIPKEKNIEWE